MTSQRVLLNIVLGLSMMGVAQAADTQTKVADKKPVKVKALKAQSPLEAPFFLINDNRITYAYYKGSSPGYSNNAGKQVAAFTHFDAWSLGTNNVNLLYVKLDHSVPTLPCFGPVQNIPVGQCAGGVAGLASIRSTLGWNELFDTKAFSVGPLTNISFLGGVDASITDVSTAPASHGVLTGLQFSFALPNRGYFNISPYYSKEWEHGTIAYSPGIAGLEGVAPPSTGYPNGIIDFSPSWGVDFNYYMDLSFLPENLRYFAVSGRGTIRGPKGGATAPYMVDPKWLRATAYSLEPFRLTMDASKLLWGPKYSHLIDVWVAWKYDRNIDGYAEAYSTSCIVNGVYTRSCSQNTVYTGITMKLGEDLPGTPALSAFGLPFFNSVDNRLTYAVLPNATSPGETDKTLKQVYAFTHNDAWAYGTNSFYAAVLKSDHRDPSSPCTATFQPEFGMSRPCAGNLEFNGALRSTLGWNEIFSTTAFASGPLKDVSFEAGADVRSNTSYQSPSKLAALAGLQFAFALPYRGYLNIAPLYYQEWNHSTYAYPNNAGNDAYGLGFGMLGSPLYTGVMPAGFTGTADGNLHYNPTWALEADYGMELGFLPESLRYFALSGHLGIYGPKGTGAYGSYTLPPAMKTATEFDLEPLRLTFDVSKALWGQKYSGFVETFVAYRYWKNKFGLDGGNPANGLCFFANGVSNKSCTEQTVYSGLTMKF